MNVKDMKHLREELGTEAQALLAVWDEKHGADSSGYDPYRHELLARSIKVVEYLIDVFEASEDEAEEEAAARPGCGGSGCSDFDAISCECLMSIRYEVHISGATAEELAEVTGKRVETARNWISGRCYPGSRETLSRVRAYVRASPRYREAVKEALRANEERCLRDSARMPRMAAFRFGE
jgi:hypothetical protein